MATREIVDTSATHRRAITEAIAVSPAEAANIIAVLSAQLAGIYKGDAGTNLSITKDGQYIAHIQMYVDKSLT